MSLLLNYKKAFIEPAKIRDYILSTEHPIGRFKAALFYKMGYNREKWEVLVDDIKKFHLTLDAGRVKTNKFGRKYSITGKIEGPNGKMEVMTSVWIILNGEDRPRFVTIYPTGGKHEI